MLCYGHPAAPKGAWGTQLQGCAHKHLLKPMATLNLNLPHIHSAQHFSVQDRTCGSAPGQVKWNGEPTLLALLLPYAQSYIKRKATASLYIPTSLPLLLTTKTTICRLFVMEYQ